MDVGQQLIAHVTQISDMANSDLEKYAKALDKWVLHRHRPASRLISVLAQS